MNEVVLREALKGDAPFLWRMLTHAASMEREDVTEAQSDAILRGYVAGFGTRAGDFGVIASRGGQPVGAAWGRLAPPDLSSAPSKVWTAQTPELAIAVLPALRGHGVGAALLTRWLADARARGFTAAMLSVREANPAARLYQRAGFETVRTITNRAGGRSWVMRCALGDVATPKPSPRDA